MVWGTFGLTHIISLLLVPVILVGLYQILKRLHGRAQDIALLCLSLVGIIAILYNLLMWGSPWEYLPLHLCSLNALLLPVVVISKRKGLGCLLLLWAFGAIFGLILNYAMAECELLSWTFFFYYFPHILYFGLPILLWKLGRIEIGVKQIPMTIGVMMTAYTLIHFVNVAINNAALTNSAGEVIQANYMFSVSPDNPVLALFWKVIPYPYWYMYMLVPVIALYLFALCGTEHLMKKRKEKRAS